jgi:chemotaxis family two-component system response regulator Rcp1
VLQILLAEDNPGDVLLVEKALEEHDIQHTLHVVQDGAEALQYLSTMGQTKAAPCPDIILLDLNLPKIEGAQVLAEFRKHPACAQTPVIVVTSSGTPRDRARVSKLGVSRFFTKPTDFENFLELGAIVRLVLAETGQDFSE